MNADEFIQWALSPERTVEERFGVEVIVERGVERWRAQHKLGMLYSWEQQSELHKARLLNPAYEPRLKADDLRKAFEVIAACKVWTAGNYKDRPVRDLKWLVFFPRLEELSLETCEVEDYSPLRNVPRLRKLDIHDEHTVDLRPVADCTMLEELSVRVRQSWVKLDGLERLEHLRKLRWMGSPLMLEGIPCLPAMRQAVVEEYLNPFPLRDARRLPEMPLLEVLELKSVFCLEGIERYPELINLKLSGPFRDVSPLTALRKLTHLWLDMPIFIELDLLHDVSPLTKLPELRFLQVMSKRPRDYSVLAEAPRLHEVRVLKDHKNPLEACAVELGMLHATLEPWQVEFHAPEPRPLPPLRIVFIDPRKNEEVPELPPLPGPPPAWENNPAFVESEKRWLNRRLEMRLRKLLDDEHWGVVQTNGWIRLKSEEAAERLGEVIEAVRGELARMRRRHSVILRVDLELPPVNDPEAMAEIGRLRELHDWEDFNRRQKEEADFLERQHRLELQKEAGGKIMPEHFAAPDTNVPSPDEESERTAQDELHEFFEEMAPDRPHPLADQYSCMGTIREDGAFYYEGGRDAVEYLLGGKLEK